MNLKKLEANYGDVTWAGKRHRLGMPISFTTYVLTPTKLYTLTGLLNLKEEQTDLYRVVDLALELPLVQRIFGCGTINIHSKDQTKPQGKLLNIKGARGVLRKIEENVDNEKKRLNIQGKDMIGVSD
jgi:uncharacterized membrane protein YdbT with pleckstrin-like domain